MADAGLHFDEVIGVEVVAGASSCRRSGLPWTALCRTIGMSARFEIVLMGSMIRVKAYGPSYERYRPNNRANPLSVD